MECDKIKRGMDNCIRSTGFKETVGTYDDYLQNKAYINSEKEKAEYDFSRCLKMEERNNDNLKFLLFKDFINSEKQIKGICINSQKNKEIVSNYQSYVYILGINEDTAEDGIYADVVQVIISNGQDGSIERTEISKEKNYYIGFGEFFSCHITKEEFFNVYDKAKSHIMENLGIEEKNKD